MRRVDLDHSDDSVDNLMFHLTRYKFVSRLVDRADRVAEIGCGTGYGARFMANYAAEVIATDADAEVFDAAHQRFSRANLAFVTDVRPRGPFDVVVCFEVIEHMDVDAGQRLLAEIRSLLTPAGVAFISTPRKIANPSENRKKHHIHEYEFDEYRAALRKVFSRVLVFTQVDEIISTHHPECAWTFVAVCHP